MHWYNVRQESLQWERKSVYQWSQSSVECRCNVLVSTVKWICFSQAPCFVFVRARAAIPVAGRSNVLGQWLRTVDVNVVMWSIPRYVGIGSGSRCHLQFSTLTTSIAWSGDQFWCYLRNIHILPIMIITFRQCSISKILLTRPDRCHFTRGVRCTAWSSEVPIVRLSSTSTRGPMKGARDCCHRLSSRTNSNVDVRCASWAKKVLVPFHRHLVVHFLLRISCVLGAPVNLYSLRKAGWRISPCS